MVTRTPQSHKPSVTPQSHTRTYTHAVTPTSYTHTASPPWADPPGSHGLSLYLHCSSPPWGPTDPSLRHFLARLGPSPIGGQASPPGRARVQSLGCCESCRRFQSTNQARGSSELGPLDEGTGRLPEQPALLPAAPRPFRADPPTHTFSCRCVLSSHQNRNKLPTF